jgi:hypothetical protein
MKLVIIEKLPVLVTDLEDVSAPAAHYGICHQQVIAFNAVFVRIELQPDHVPPPLLYIQEGPD